MSSAHDWFEWCKKVKAVREQVVRCEWREGEKDMDDKSHLWWLMTNQRRAQAWFGSDLYVGTLIVIPSAAGLALQCTFLLLPSFPLLE